MLNNDGLVCMIDEMTPPPTLSGPPVSRWWGALPEFRRDILGFLLSCQAYGDVVKLPVGLVFELLLRQRGAVTYILNHPADIKHVLVTNQDNYRKERAAAVESRIFGQGVLHTEGETHHRQRRLLLPFFHGTHVTAYADLITDKTGDLVANWQDGAIVDIRQEMARVSRSVIERLLFGQDVGPEDDSVVQEAMAATHGLVKLQQHSLLAALTPLWVPTKPHRQFVHGYEAMETMIGRLIQQRRTVSHQQNDILALLLAATDAEGRPLSDVEIRDELVTLLLAGHETTANALTWTWVLLSHSRSVRERLMREVNEVVGDRLPTAADLPRLRYLKMIWDESLRLYPPAWALHTRIAYDEDRLPSGAVLPPKAPVFISPWSVHRNPRWFPDPDRFDPERFSQDAKRTQTPYSYIPFGAGGRRCLGESFAEFEGLLILATIASQFHLRLVDGRTILPDPLITLRQHGPVQMIVQRVTMATSMFAS